MKSISNYVSITLILLVSILLVHHFTEYLSLKSSSIRSVLERENNIAPQYYVVNNSKYIAIPGEIHVVYGENYTIIYNSTDLTIIKDPINEKLIIVSESDIIEI